MRTLIFILLIVPTQARAESLKAVLVAPEHAEAGSDLYLDASQSTGDIEHFLYRVTPVMEGKIQIDTRDKRRPRLLTYPGAWTVELIVVSQDGEQSRCYRTINVPGGTPCPTPEPKPTPTPVPTPTPIPPPTPPPPPPVDPVIPVGEFGIAPKVAALCQAVMSADRVGECKKLADASDALAAQIAAGALTDPQKVLNEMALALKGLSPGWLVVAPKIQAGLQEVYAAHKNGRLKVSVGLSGITMADKTGWQTLLKEIAVGLRAVK